MFLRTVLALDNVSDLDSSRKLVRQIETDSLLWDNIGSKMLPVPRYGISSLQYTQISMTCQEGLPYRYVTVWGYLLLKK